MWSWITSSPCWLYDLQGVTVAVQAAPPTVQAAVKTANRITSSLEVSPIALSNHFGFFND